MEEIRKVAVIGTGTMGNGIALWFAKAGLGVSLRDVDQEFLDRARKTQDETLKALSAAGAVAEGEEEAIRGRIRGTTDLAEALEGVDFVLEAVPEALELKRSVFAELEMVAPPGIPLASNTSGISISLIAEGVRDPSRVVGMHWWNPPHVVRVIEVIRGRKSSDAVVETTRALVERIGKKPVMVKKDVPGFLGNRILYALLRETMYCYEQGVADAEVAEAVTDLEAGAVTAVIPSGLFFDVYIVWEREPERELDEAQTAELTGRLLNDWREQERALVAITFDLSIGEEEWIVNRVVGDVSAVLDE